MTEKDRREALMHSEIHHGPLNRRVYLLRLADRDVPHIIPRLEGLARQKGYGKILARIPGRRRAAFQASGFAPEAHIPGYVRGKEDLFFLSKYPNPNRRRERHPRRVRENWAALSRAAGSPQGRPAAPKQAGRCAVTPCGSEDADEISGIYRSVFASYPFPVMEPDYVRRAMEEDAEYVCIRKNGRIIAAAAAETDPENQSVEMTDFAVLPEWRKQGMAAALLREMERRMAGRGMRTAFTIARTLSAGMNMTFKKAGYVCAGKLTNNTHISGKIESMWVWYKRMLA